MDTVKNVLGRWGRKVAEATKKAEDLAGDTWQHREPLTFFLTPLLIIVTVWFMI